jgi:hypothetical protein
MGRRQLHLLLYLFWWLFCCNGSSSAAEIFTLPDKIQGFTGIVVKGEIDFGDEERFESIALGVEEGLVLLESDGGRVDPALRIGKAMRLRRYLSAVPFGSRCASACGLIWLAGKERLVFPGGTVGFHVAYRSASGRNEESGQANALVGAYLNQLGLPDRAIEYVTRAAPDSMIWLTQVDADRYGIAAYFVPSNDPSAPPLPEPDSVRPADAPPAGEAQRFQRAEGRDVYGFDISKKGLSIRSIDACERACIQNSDCRAYSFNSKGKCYLKSGGDKLVWNPDVTAGFTPELAAQLRPSKMAFYSSTDLKGEEYSFALNSSVEECMTKCESADNCTGFTFARKDRGKCSLRRGKLRKFPSKQIMSGVKTRD